MVRTPTLAKIIVGEDTDTGKKAVVGVSNDDKRTYNITVF
jgi:hypothetical protein